MARRVFIAWQLYLPNVLALHLRPIDLPFISKHGKERVSNDLRKAKAPDESDGVEKVGVSRAGVYPEVVECWAQKRCI